MKLLRARIEKFRIIRELDCEFSTDPERNVTVIRAANESGKTTLLAALQWCLFGEEGLPDQGKSFRLSPIDASTGAKTRVTTSVEIDYETATRTDTRAYRLIRSVTEVVRGGEWDRERDNLTLFHLSANGARPVESPDAHLRPHLPHELREVFFTDGDRALSFIEGRKGDQVKRVEGAIRSLLGLSVVEDAQTHLNRVASDLNRQIRKDGGSRRELQEASKELTDLEERLPRAEEEARRAREEKVRLQDLEEDADRKLSEALRKGNREELERTRASANRRRRDAEAEVAQAARDHSNLFRSELLGKQLLAGPFKKAKDLLDNLRNQGKIPNQTIPVLEDRLKQLMCICGESLDTSDPKGQRRCAHIQHLIDESRGADVIQEKVTALYYGAQDLLRPPQEQTWGDAYRKAFQRRQAASDRAKEAGEEEAGVEAQIADLPDVDIQQLRSARERYRAQARAAHDAEIRAQGQLRGLHDERKRLEGERDRLLRHDEKGRKLGSELQVADDVQQVLKHALEAMKTKELEAVSDRMNGLFLNMIGADPSQRSIITRAAINPEFRIVVFGRHDHPLDPSVDLNGASRRALTIAFILALTNVSEVEAPNVIDTPLGMMSGYVKQAVLQLASRESAQLILFLTHSEIAGCEDVLDARAGLVYTLTNPAHYPRILVHDPGVDEVTILKCACNHRESCQVCERRDEVDLGDGGEETA